MKQVTRLTLGQQYALMNLLKEEYEVRKQNDKDFADYAKGRGTAHQMGRTF